MPDEPKPDLSQGPASGRSVLTVNGGSSSLKFAVFTLADLASDPARGVSGKFERVGHPDATLTCQPGPGAPKTSYKVDAKDTAAAAGVLAKWLKSHELPAHLSAVGHRVVHGGPRHNAPQRVTPELIADLKSIQAFDPDHLPGEITLIESLGALRDGLPQFACFDTAFHNAMPRVAKILPIPRRYEAQGVRRYGFHGLSYEYLMGKLREEGKAGGRVILAHLGSGASLAAVKDGASLDTSMAFTPTAGLVMGTRTGDLDPGLVDYFARNEGMTAERFHTMVNTESGLLGVSETSADLRDLLKARASDPRAAEAVDLFCYQIKKWVGAYAAALGGLDTLVFSGGIGENSPEVRNQVCEGLEFLGIGLEPGRNQANASTISANDSSVAVRVIPTDEELTIARSVARLLDAPPS